MLSLYIVLQTVALYPPPMQQRTALTVIINQLSYQRVQPIDETK